MNNYHKINSNPTISMYLVEKFASNNGYYNTIINIGMFVLGKPFVKIVI